MKDFLNQMTRKFLLGESTRPDVLSYIQSVNEILQKLSPKSLREKRSVDIAKEHLNEIRRQTKQLNERVALLEEQVSILEESKEK